MRFAACVLLAVELGSALALPRPGMAPRSDISARSKVAEVKVEEAMVAEAKVEEAKVEVAKVEKPKAKAGKAKHVAVEVPPAEAAAPPAEAAAPPAEEEVAAPAEGEEEAVENEVVLEGVFGTAVALEGGDLKQDTEFTPSAIGKFEFEFQAAAADELTVTENKTPAAAPAGFVAVEPSSFQVALAQSKGVGLTLSKIDYIFDAANADLANLDLTQAVIGRLCEATGTFVIDEALGELEFEVEENEVTLNLNKAVTSEAEWGIFLPDAAVAGMLQAMVSPAAGNATAA